MLNILRHGRRNRRNCTAHLDAMEPRFLLASQVISSPSSPITALAGSGIAVPVQYTASDGDNTLSGLGLRMHYNSAKLTWNSLSSVFATGLVSQDAAPQSDTTNLDGDASTDQFIAVRWADIFSAAWPGTTLPQALFTGNFALAAGLVGGDTTDIRFTAIETAAGYAFDSTPVPVAVSAANASPTDITLSASSIAENQPVGTVVGNFSTNDPDVGSTFTYSLIGGAGSGDIDSFTISGNQLKTAASFNYATKSSYSIRVRTTDQGGLTFEKAFTITVSPIGKSQVVSSSSSPITATSGSTITVPVQYTTTDADNALSGLGLRMYYDSSKLTWNNLGGVFAAGLISQDATPQSDSANLDGDASTDRFISVRWADIFSAAWPGTTLPQSLFTGSFTLAAGLADGDTTDIRFAAIETAAGYAFQSTPVHVVVGSVNASPTDMVLSSSGIAENQSAGTAVGSFSTTDPDVGNTFIYTLVSGTASADNGSFTISGNQLKTAASFDYETKSSYSVRVRSTDQGGLYTEKVFAITLTNVNETPTDVVLSSMSVAENQAAGIVVGTLSSSDPDNGDALAYSLVNGVGSTDNASFTISDNQFRTAASFDFETKSNYSVRVRTTDQGGLWFEKSFTITVIPSVHAPTDIALSSTTVPEDQPVGTVVGALSTSDADIGDSFTYSLVNGTGSADNAKFMINGDQLLTNSTFSYVPGKVYAIRIRSTDSEGLSVEKSLGIGVIGLPEFGMTGGKKATTLFVMDADDDLVTFKLSGGGLGALWGNQISLIGTTSKSVLTISVKKNRAGGDGLVTIGNISSDGLIKSVSGPAVVLSGQMLLNTLGQSAGRATVSVKLRQIGNSDIQVKCLPVASIAVSGDVSNSRIVTTGSIMKFSAATVLNSDILVGVDTSFAGDFASGAGDFIDTTAKLGSLTITGRRLPSGSSHPAYVVGSHISAPAVGTVNLLNVPTDSGPVVHVLNDVGVLKVSHSKLVGEPMMASGTWKAGSHRVIWEVV